MTNNDMNASKTSVLFLYGIDEHSQPFEIDSTIKLVHDATLALSERGWRVVPLQITHDLVTPLKPFSPSEWIVFNMCEGSPQQDFYYAKAARTLGELGYTFTGSDSASLEETQYKWTMKEMLDQSNVPTPKWTLCKNANELRFDKYPAIVKPAAEHCSYGITRESVVLNLDEAKRQAAKIIHDFLQPALIESFLDSAEYNVSVWGSDAHPAGFEVLGISTMTYDYFDDVHDRLCTFDAKWTPQSEAYQHIPAICPAPINDELKHEIERVAIAAYRASGCRDYGRVDIRCDGAQPMAIDVNANCGLSIDDGFSNAARLCKDMKYGEMLERIVELAIARRSTDGERQTTNDKRQAADEEIRNSEPLEAHS
jgi:D-alanine-D-alanine ligase